MERLRLETKDNPPPPYPMKPASSPRHRKITFARLATCILNVERAFKRSSRAREEEFLQAAETGDVTRLRALLCNTRDLNIDCNDQLGRTPLHLAVVNEQKEAVKVLLDHVDKRRVYQALLSAINQGNEEIAETIIEHPKYAEVSHEIKEHGRAFFYLNKFHDDNQFSEEMTPLMLAAQQNRFEVVMALLLKGEAIDKPHKCGCACAECDEMAERDELRFARSRLNAYRALSSEAYISLSSDDPILTCFELRKELHQVATEEKYYATEYTRLATGLSEYVVRLLDKVHSNEELHAILSATIHDHSDITPDDLPRLQLAIKYKEKRFVAHPSCQKKLSTLWYRGFHKIQHNLVVHTCLLLAVVCLYPLLAFVYILAPATKIGRMVGAPCIKFVAQATSYLVFLSLILVHGHVEQSKLCGSRMRDYPKFNSSYSQVRLNLSDSLRAMDRMCVRSHHPAVLEMLIVLWITGLVWQAIRQIYSFGLREHFIDVYNAMDFFMLKFYIASLTLRRLTHFKVRKSLEYFSQHDSWVALTKDDSQALYKFYWINADRYYWDAWDPVHMYEALFSVGNIINFARLFHLLAISEHLGPMLISLERMIKDVLKFMSTFVLIFLAFMVGMYNLYWYYDPEVRGQAEIQDHQIKTRAEREFGNLEYTFRSIYWALFGLRDSKAVELGPGYKLTESVGYIVFGVYNWGAVIILLNMLIAMMTRSFDKIATDQETEWKFVRSKLYMEYIKADCTLPVPLNIIPTPRAIASVFSKLSCCRQEEFRIDEEDVIFSSMNGGGRLLDNKEDSVSTSQAAAGSGYTKPRAEETKRRKSSSFGKRLIHNLNTRKFPVLACTEDSDDYKAVIKRVVRRYIFEHLLASVSSADGSDVESIKVQTGIIQHEIQAMKPQLERELAELRAQYASLSNCLTDIREQMGFMTKLCANIRPRDPITSSASSSSSSSPASSDGPEVADGYVIKPKVNVVKERLLSRPTEMTKSLRLVGSEETRL